MHESDDRRSLPVTRGEFEGFRDQVLDGLTTLGKEVRAQSTATAQKFDELSRQRQWSLGTVIAVVAVVGTPLVFTVRNLYQTEQTAEILTDHIAWGERRNNEIEEGEAVLRERARGLEGRAIEAETQNKWTADVINVTHDYEDRLNRAYCAVCEKAGLSSRIVFPDRGYSPLMEIGESPQNGHSNK